ARSPPHSYRCGVFYLNVASERCHIGLDTFDRADEPVHEIDVVTGLIHQGAAVELPRAPPFGAVIVGLRSRPEHIDGHHVDATEAALLDGTLQKLQRCVAAILLDDE